MIFLRLNNFLRGSLRKLCASLRKTANELEGRRNDEFETETQIRNSKPETVSKLANTKLETRNQQSPRVKD